MNPLGQRTNKDRFIKFCDLCDPTHKVQYTSEAHYESHINGKKHQLSERQVEIDRMNIPLRRTIVKSVSKTPPPWAKLPRTDSKPQPSEPPKLFFTPSAPPRQAPVPVPKTPTTVFKAVPPHRHDDVQSNTVGSLRRSPRSNQDMEIEIQNLKQEVERYKNENASLNDEVTGLRERVSEAEKGERDAKALLRRYFGDCSCINTALYSDEDI